MYVFRDRRVLVALQNRGYLATSRTKAPTAGCAIAVAPGTTWPAASAVSVAAKGKARRRG